MNFPVTMRAAPTLEHTSSTNYWVSEYPDDKFDTVNITSTTTNGTFCYNSTESSGTAGTATGVAGASGGSEIDFIAEL